MKEGVFVDTSAWYALADRRDVHFSQAAPLLQRLVRERQELVTTNHVVAESYMLVRIRLGTAAAQRFLYRIRTSAYVRRVFVLEEWEEAAEDMLAQYRDHAFSYVDATSFVAMRRLGLTIAFAYDTHFTVAGFTAREEI